MGLFRDRGDRPRLFGRAHERRDDRATGDMTAATSVLDRAVATIALSRRRAETGWNTREPDRLPVVQCDLMDR